jgi:lipopolysaccharide export LptBFGC system permease protein LptF
MKNSEKKERGAGALWVPALQSYVLGEVFKIFSLTLVLLSFIFILTTTLRFLHEGVSLVQFVTKIPYVVLYFMPFVMPVSVLSGITLALGRMVQDREVTAMRSAGINYACLVLPLLIFAFILSLAAVWLQDIIIPVCYRKQREVQTAFTREILTLSEGANKSVRWKGGSLFISRYSGSDLEGVIFWSKREKETVEIRAVRGRLTITPDESRAVLDLENVQFTFFEPEYMRVYSSNYRQMIKLKSKFRVSAKGLASSALKEHIKRFDEKILGEEAELAALEAGLEKSADTNERRDIRKKIRKIKNDLKHDRRRLVFARAEYYRRTPFAFATLALAFLALPVALLLNHKNRLVPFFAAFMLGLFVCYIPMSIVSIFAEGGKVNPRILQWAGNAASFVTGGVLMRRLFRS